MTDRKQALIALRDKVKAGEWQAAGDGNDTWLAIFDAGLQPLYAWIYEAWDRNSLDAAKALDVSLPTPDAVMDPATMARILFSKNGARLWLIWKLDRLIDLEAAGKP